MRRLSLSCSVLLLALPLSSAALAQAAGLQSSTETLPPAAVQMPARPVPPKVPGSAVPDTVMPDAVMPGAMQHRPASPRGEGELLRDLLGQQLPARPAVPQQPGNDVFGAIQEVVAILEADPKTDWGRVNIDALRAHLIDMNEVMLNAEAKVEAIAGGIRVSVSGTGRTLAAIQRMVPDQARMLDGHDGWHVVAEDRPDGAILTVTAKDARQTAKIRGLGFSGVMTTGSHHQLHHLAIARGQPIKHSPPAPAKAH
jgi:hypothetical protein